MRILSCLLVLLMLAGAAFAALPATVVWEANPSATASNVNAGGFDIASTGLPTDLTCTGGTGNSADCTSSTGGTWPTFPTGTWLWISGASGTNWNINGKNDGTTTTGGGCFWPVTAATTHLTVNTSIGAGVCLYDAAAANVTAPNIPQHWVANTVAGIGVASPSSGTYGIDYSQATAAMLASNATLGAVHTSSTTMTSTAAFHPSMVHNLVHVTTTGTAAHCTIGFYEITVYTSTSAVTTDRSIQDGTGTDCIAGTGSVGGAISLGAANDSLPFNAAVAGNVFWMHSGTYTIAAGWTPANGSTVAAPGMIVGYGTRRGDVPVGASRPVISAGANAVGPASNYMQVHNLIITGNSSSATGLFYMSGSATTTSNVKVINTSTAAGYLAIKIASSAMAINCEAISYRGIAFTTGGYDVILGLYAHDSDTGVMIGGTGNTITDSIIADNVTYAISSNTAMNTGTHLINDTLYGSENKRGTGFSIYTGSGSMRLVNSIFYGFVTAISDADVQQAGFSNTNDFYNNTADGSNWEKGISDLALNPGFANVVQTTGTGASSSTNVLTIGSGTFSTSIVDNQDFVYLSAGTGTGIALTKYLITSHTDTTLTLDSNITSSGSGSAITYYITTGHNFLPGNNLRAKGFPGSFPAGLTTGQLGIGGVQPAGQHAAGFQR